MKKEIREKIGSGGFDVDDVEDKTYEQVIEELQTAYKNLKEKYPNFKKFLFDVSYYSDWRSFETIGVRDETDREYNQRILEESNAGERIKQKELALLAELKAKYEG